MFSNITLRGGLMMNINETPNKNIHCTVNQCKNHCGSENFCALNCVNIGTQGQEKDPKCPECTKCSSFEVESKK